MDKELENKDKIEASNRGDSGFGRVSIGAYSPDLTFKAWEDGKRPWSASPQGRLAIRAFSRGVLGAVFFTAGGLLTRRWLHSDTGGRYVMEEPWAKQIDPRQGGNPLKFIAKLIDTVAGKPIEFAVNALGGDGKRAVRFRSSKFAGNFQKSGYRGRGLGNEAVSITFDFFCASVGDAWGRDIAGWFDPNVKKKWMKDGHIDFPAAVKQSLKSVTHYITYNGGEDWAVAIPYVYFMRGHRDLIHHFSPGFHYDAHRNLNGASFKVRNGGIVGNFNMEGALDLQNRFVTYNIGTLMYRELWDFLSRKIKGEHAVLYGDPDPAHARRRSVTEKAGNLFKWMARAAVKAGIYMQFAVPFFWITRAPQGNYRGIFIDPDKNAMLCYEDPTAPPGQPKIKAVYANDLVSGKVSEHTPVFWARHEPVRGVPEAKQFARVSGEMTGAASPIAKWGGRKFNAFDPKLVHNPIDKGLQVVGRANRTLSYGMDKVTAHFEDSVLARPIKKMLMLNPDERTDGRGRKIAPDSFARFNHGFINAAVSYTPYMYMKAEAARFWDDGRMDAAAERMIDGAAKLNWGEFKAGVGEVWHAFLHQPLADPKREAVAQHRKLLDTSLTDSVNLDSSHARAKQARREAALSWRERAIQGEKPEVGADRPRSHAEREEMREALKEMQPPTPSIN